MRDRSAQIVLLVSGIIHVIKKDLAGFKGSDNDPVSAIWDGSVGRISTGGEVGHKQRLTGWASSRKGTWFLGCWGHVDWYHTYQWRAWHTTVRILCLMDDLWVSCFHGEEISKIKTQSGICIHECSGQPPPPPFLSSWQAAANIWNLTQHLASHFLTFYPPWKVSLVIHSK